MSKYRQAAKIDTNQKDIVETLRSIPGVSVELDHDDILVGYKDVTRWYEIKPPDCLSKKDGQILESKKKKSQKKLDETWTGHRCYITSIDQILKDLGII